MFRNRDWGIHGTFLGWIAHFATVFVASFTGVVLAGVLLVMMARAYLHWSVADAAAKIGQRSTAKQLP